MSKKIVFLLAVLALLATDAAAQMGLPSDWLSTTTGPVSTNSTCRVSNCQTCATGSQVKCGTCKDGYKLRKDGLCELMCRVVYCTVCYSNDNTKCATCGYGYLRNSQYLCVKRKRDSATAPLPSSLLVGASMLVASVALFVL